MKNNDVYTYRKFISSLYNKSINGVSKTDIFDNISDLLSNDNNVRAFSVDTLNKEIVITFEKLDQDSVALYINKIKDILLDYIDNNIEENIPEGLDEFLSSNNLFDNWILGNTLTIRL